MTPRKALFAGSLGLAASVAFAPLIPATTPVASAGSYGASCDNSHGDKVFMRCVGKFKLGCKGKVTSNASSGTVTCTYRSSVGAELEPDVSAGQDPARDSEASGDAVRSSGQVHDSVP